MKYLALFAISMRQTLGSRAAIVARLGLYLVLMLIFSRLWAAVGGATGLVARTPAELLWYFGLTEVIVIAMPFLFVGIEEDVRRGDIAYRIARPVSYFWAKVAEGAGEMTVRFVALAGLGLPCVGLLAGGLPPDPRGLLLALPLAYVATLALVVMQVGVGLAAFWVQEAAPLHWVSQKLVFVFGGLLFPLEVYPRWLHGVADATPFSAFVHGCARLVFDFDPELALWTLLRVGAWGALLLAAVAWLYRRGLEIVDVNGG